MSRFFASTRTASSVAPGSIATDPWSKRTRSPSRSSATPGDRGNRTLECRIAARIAPGVEVGKAIGDAVVGRRVIEKVRDPKYIAAAAREHLVADRALDRIGIRFRVRLGEGDRDLHRPAGAHRVAVFEEALRERHAADEVLVDVAQLQLRLRGVEALAVGAAVG